MMKREDEQHIYVAEDDAISRSKQAQPPQSQQRLQQPNWLTNQELSVVMPNLDYDKQSIKVKSTGS